MISRVMAFMLVLNLIHKKLKMMRLSMGLTNQFGALALSGVAFIDERS
jgi:hypothetical protein